MPTLTNKQRVFIEEYLRCWNATEAARRAGYSEKYLHTNANKILQNAVIAAEIEKRLAELGVGSKEATAAIARGHVREPNKPSHVYMIREDYLGLIKIGIAINPASRLATLQIACPQNLTLVGAMRTINALRVEIELHTRYSDKHYRGEWFRLTDEDIENILLEWLDYQKNTKHLLKSTLDASMQLNLI